MFLSYAVEGFLYRRRLTAFRGVLQRTDVHGELAPPSNLQARQKRPGEKPDKGIETYRP